MLYSSYENLCREHAALQKEFDKRVQAGITAYEALQTQLNETQTKLMRTGCELDSAKVQFTAREKDFTSMQESNKNAYRDAYREGFADGVAEEQKRIAT